jgi:CheY-like chemotaxis protein/two-component sensor histidine kinase
MEIDTMSLHTSSTSADRARQLNVLVIDDDDHVRAALEQRLTAASMEVVACADGLEALARLRAGLSPDLIVLDLQMPEMSGWEFRVEQKKVPEWATIPVIVLSGDHSAQAEAIDATAYLTKPLEADVLISTVQRVCEDTQRRQALARASELNRLVSLGALVGGIAHEINNPLTFVFGSLDILQRQLVGLARPDLAAEPFSIATALRTLEHAKDGAERIAAVVRSASMFALADLESVDSVDVHDVLESSLQIASNEIRHGAHLVRAYGQVPHVLANPAKLGQVFLNLLLNAVYSIRDAQGRNHVLRISTALDGECVVVSITDSATTLDAGALACMFNPTTAITSGQTRMHFGLAVSREVVEEMGGRIEVETLQPKGTVFRVRLPSHTRSSFPPPAPRPPTRVKTGRASVVIIDDEPLMCELFAAMLSDAYDVAAFTSPRAALASILEGNFDVILCDVMMPELNGVDLYSRATRERPDVSERFVFVTGGAFTERARVFLRQTGRRTLRKPCERADLVAVIEQVLVSAERTQTH